MITLTITTKDWLGSEKHKLYFKKMIFIIEIIGSLQEEKTIKKHTKWQVINLLITCHFLLIYQYLQEFSKFKNDY